MIWNTAGLAADWKVEPLSEITTKVGSGATPRGGRATYPKSGTPFIRSQNVHFDGFRPDGLAYLTDAQAKLLDGARVEADDVLLNITGASIGRVCVAPEEYAGARVNQHVCIIRPTAVSPEFLAFYLASPQVQEAIVQGNYGATREALTKTQILELPVPLPSPSEEKSITEAGRAAVVTLASARAHLADARIAVVAIRDAALATAYDDAAAEDGAATERLADLLRESLRNGYSATPVNHETETRVLTLTATTSGEFDPRHFKYTDETISADSPAWLQPGDVVVQRGNTAEYVGTPALYDGEPNQFLYPDLMIRVRAKKEIDPRYLWYMLLAPQVRNFLRERATGSAGNMPKINQRVLGEAPIPLPSKEARASVIAEIDSVRERVQATTSAIDHADLQIQRIFQSLLGRLFRGTGTAEE